MRDYDRYSKPLKAQGHAHAFRQSIKNQNGQKKKDNHSQLLLLKECVWPVGGSKVLWRKPGNCEETADCYHSDYFWFPCC